MTTTPDEFTGMIERDFFQAVVKDRLGSGMSRRVYSVNFNEDAVLKLETGAGLFYNVLEWQFWLDVQHTKWVDWFAPCLGISPCGTVLTQRKTTPLRDNELPDKIPSFLTDLKPDNFGWLDGRIVCHDYSINKIEQKGFSGARLAKADWHLPE